MYLLMGYRSNQPLLPKFVSAYEQLSVVKVDFENYCQKAQDEDSIYRHYSDFKIFTFDEEESSDLLYHWNKEEHEATQEPIVTYNYATGA